MSDHLKSGFVSLVGRPNAGKSTLLNALVGQKVAIVANQPQTTRTTIQGVVNVPGAQIIFVDTPGIHQGDSPLNKRLMKTVHAALEERDLLLFLADATHPIVEDDRRAIQLASKTGAPMLLVLNKIDRLKDKAELLPLIELYKAAHPFVDFVPISALKGDGLDELRRLVIERLPEGPAYFPEDYVTDQPERFLAAELIREKALAATRQEVPHAVAVFVDSLGRDSASDPHLSCHAARGARGPEAHPDRREGRRAQENRHRRAARHRTPVRDSRVSGPSCPRGGGMARKGYIPECARLAYNER